VIKQVQRVINGVIKQIDMKEKTFIGYLLRNIKEDFWDDAGIIERGLIVFNIVLLCISPWL
jgi:hypothetical protein